MYRRSPHLQTHAAPASRVVAATQVGAECAAVDDARARDRGLFVAVDDLRFGDPDRFEVPLISPIDDPPLSPAM